MLHEIPPKLAHQTGMPYLAGDHHDDADDDDDTYQCFYDGVTYMFLRRQYG